MIFSSIGRRRGVAAATAAVLAASVLNGGPATAAPPGGPSRTVIVEFDAPPAITAAPGRGTVDEPTRQRVRQARAKVTATERAVDRAAERARIKLTHRRSYQLLLPGMAVEVAANQVAALRRLPGVKAVHDVVTVQTRTTASVPLVGAPQVWQRTDAQGRAARGAGVTVAVIDTGVDYRHPSLGGGFGPGHKVVGGYDFVNDDADPVDDNAHGTHVAGIVAGTGAGGDKAVTGVAPDATLTAYKVLNAWGYGQTDDLVAALEAAVDPANPYRADVINMSLGGPGDGTDALGLAATRAAQAGVTVVAAAGNSGPGERSIGSPAAADGVIAVGASTSGLRLPVVDLASPRKERIQTYRSEISANPPADPVTADVVDVGEGTAADYDRAGDVRGKIVLVSGPPHPDPNPYEVDRFIEAERRGALAAIGYWSRSQAPMLAGELRATPHTTLGAREELRFERLVVLGMDDPNQYAALHDLMAAGPIRMTLSSEDATDRIASFSSRGPDPRWRLKPEIAAPGVEIRSSVPTSLWEPGVFRFSGTSMAAPHVAGAAALLRQLWPDVPAKRISGALIGSAKALEVGPTVGGAGRLDVAAALSAAVTAEPPALSLGLADLTRSQIRADGTVTLRNDGDRPQQLRLAVAPGPGSQGRVHVEPEQVTVAPGGTATVTVRFAGDAPDQGSADISGWLTVDAPDGTSDLRVPYLLAVRTPQVYVTPDPSDGRTEAFLYTLEPAAAAPTVTVRGPRGTEREVPVRHDHGLWWRAPVTGDGPGVYTLTASVPTAAGPKLVGRTTFEVAADPGTGRWELVGPNSTGGQLATTPADPNRLAVAPPYGPGIWLTTDRARTWRYVRLGPVAAGMPTVLIDPQRADRMWVAVNGGFDPTYQGKVLRTDDAGATWRTLTFPDTRIDGFAQDPSTRTLAAVTADAVLTSRDGGDTWTPAPAPWSGGVNDIGFAGGDLYVATNQGLWRWAGLTGQPVLVRPASGYFTAPDAIAVVGETITVSQRDDDVWGSRDQGRTWQRLLETTSLWTLKGSGDVLIADGFRQTWLSRDQGTTWTRITEPADAIVYDLAHWPGGDTLLMSFEDVGVYATDDAATYTRIGVPGQSADRMAVSGGNLLVGTPVDLYRTALPGDPAKLEWGRSGGEGRIGQAVRGLVVPPDEPDTVWKLYMNAWFGTRLMRSRDGGDTWSQVVMNDLTPFDLVVHPADTRRLVIPYVDIVGAGLFVSRDGGTSWRKIDHKARYAAVAGDPGNADRLWLGGMDGLWRSDDGGATRVKVLDGAVTALHVDGQRVVAAGATIRISTDGGRSFVDARAIGAGRTGLPIQVSQIIEVGNVLYAGTTAYSEAGLLKGGRGVLRSVDGGRSWMSIGAGLPDPSVRSLVASPDGRWLFAGTESGGVYRLPIGR